MKKEVSKKREAVAKLEKRAMNCGMATVFIWFINVLLTRYINPQSMLAMLLSILILVLGIVAVVAGTKALKLDPKSETAKTGRLIGGAAAILKVATLFVTMAMI